MAGFFIVQKQLTKEIKMKRAINKPSHIETDPYQPVLKASALLELSSLLRKERYEDCPAIIALAKEFGASGDEIRATLAGLNQTSGP